MISRKRKVPIQSGSESDSSGYSLVQVVSDDEIDISSALTARTPKNAGKQKEIDGDDNDEDLHEMIRASIAKRDVKSGTELLKKTKGKTKVTKGEVGGGSFQSMGTCIEAHPLKASNKSFPIFDRSPSLTFAFLDSSRLPDTNAYSTPFHPCSSIRPTSGPRRHGSHRFRKITGIYGATCATFKWSSCHHLWGTGTHFVTCARTCSASAESGQGISERMAWRLGRSCRRRKGYRGHKKRPKFAVGSCCRGRRAR